MISRASVHNISVMRFCAWDWGIALRSIKANMIIPRIAENLTDDNNIKFGCLSGLWWRKTQMKIESDIADAALHQSDSETRLKLCHFVSQYP